MRHVVLTRFNLPRAGLKYLRDEWLEYRLDLFKRYTFASLSAQTEQRFKWLVLLDHRTPGWLCKEFEKLETECQQMRPLYVTGPPGRAIRARIQGDGLVMTTRIDSDDAFAVDYFEHLHAAAEDRGAGVCINPRNGCKLWKGRVIEHRHNSTPFVSLIEHASVAEGVFAYKHGEMPLHCEMVQIEKPHSFLIVCHGDNISNRVTTAKKPEELGVPFGRFRKRFGVTCSIT